MRERIDVGEIFLHKSFIDDGDGETTCYILLREAAPFVNRYPESAKIFWGDPPEEVVKFLMRQNIPYKEASEIVNELFDERAATLRTDGIGKIVTGIGMACVPVAAWFFFTRIGVIPMKLFALTVMVGCWGAYRILKGSIMVVSPRSETGDVAAQ